MAARLRQVLEEAGPVQFIGLCVTTCLGVFIGLTENAVSTKNAQNEAHQTWGICRYRTFRQ
jgi:hypothetical protein